MNRINVEDFAEIMVEAQTNDRYWFALESRSGVPHAFRIQKVRLVDHNTDYDLLVIVNDEGFVERVYNLFRYLDVDRSNSASARRRAVTRILWDYLHEYNREMRMPAPIDLGVETEVDTVESHKESQRAFDSFLYRSLAGMGKY